MTGEEIQSLEALQAALLEHAEAAATTAQFLLDNALRTPSAAAWRKDFDRVHQGAVRLYRSIRERLAPAAFPAEAGPYEDALHRARHDIRGELGHVLNRCQIVMIEAEDLAPELRADLDRIRASMAACVGHLDRSREAPRETTPAPESAGPEEPASETMEAADGAAPEAVAPPARAAAAVSDEAVILVADDMRTSRELLGRFLKSQGHRVTYARDGQEALDLLARADFDLVLLDVMMPRVNGFQVLEALRRAGTLAHTPVIVISGMDAGANVVRCVEMGAEDFLPRPIDMALLKARVNASLERKRLREREFAQFFTPELARQFARHPERLAEGRSVEITILFGDIVGFSRISERVGPAETIRWVSDTMDVLSECVRREKGVLVDYIGDMVIALWGAPDPQPDHADRACRAAIAMQRALPEVDRRWRERVGAPTEVAIGINTGEAFVGNTGTPRRFKYGALGNTVNLASRVQSATKFVQAGVLMTGSTHAKLRTPFRRRRLGKVRVNNIEQPVDLYEIAAAQVKDWTGLRRAYERALDRFEAKELHQASAILGPLLVEHPDDGPSLLLMSRVVDALLKPDRFDPVWTFRGK